MREIQVFDPEQSVEILERRLPHWSQAGTISFITWRTWDSIPAHVLKQWLLERETWLKQHGVNLKAIDWQKQFDQLPRALTTEFQQIVSDLWHEHLDECHGACILKQPAISRIVANSLLHFDGERYELTDFVIMPNHVHVLAAFSDEIAMVRQCDS
jgi:putative transposase